MGRGQLGCAVVRAGSVLRLSLRARMSDSDGEEGARAGDPKLGTGPACWEPLGRTWSGCPGAFVWEA